MAVLVFIEPDASRDELVVCLNHYTAEAKAEARRGFSGIHGKRYDDLHDTLNALVTAVNARPLVTLGSE